MDCATRAACRASAQLKQGWAGLSRAALDRQDKERQKHRGGDRFGDVFGGDLSQPHKSSKLK